MADVKISELPAASTPLAGTEQIPLVQDATTKQITVSNLLTSANLGTPSAINLANATNVPMDEASGVLAVANGGTGTATPALVAGTNVTISGSWPNQTINSTYSGAVTSVTGTAPVVSSGGTTPAISMAAATGSVNGYLTSTDWTTFNNKLTSGGPLGTPSSGTATNLTGLPLSTGVTGLLPVANGGTGTATPNLVAGSNVTISGTWPNQTIAAAGAAQVYPDAGIANSTGSAWGTSYSTTGSGTVVALATSPTFVTPALGVPASGDFSTGTFTWPTFNQNTTGTAANITATSNSSLTTLSSLSLPGSQVSGNISGNAGNVSGIVAVANGGTGTATPSLVAGTNVTITGTWPNQTIAASGGGGGSGTVTSVDVSGGTTGLTTSGGPVTTSGTITIGGTLATTNGGTGLTSFTANGVLYASSTSALTSGSALTFDGTKVEVSNGTFRASNTSGWYTNLTATGLTNFSTTMDFDSVSSYLFKIATAEQMRLTSTGLGIGTSSPAAKLDVQAGANSDAVGIRSTLNTNGSAVAGVALFGGNSSGTSVAYSGIYGNIDSNTAGSHGGGMRFYTATSGSFTEKMRLDSAGNLGLGVTPSAWRSGDVALDIGSIASLVSAQSSNTRLYNNTFVASGGTNTYKTSSFASYYDQGSGVHRWFTAPSGTAGNAISFTQAMTLDASGNLGVGLSNPTSRLHVSALNGDIARISGVTRSLYFGADSGGVMIATGSAQTGVGTYYSAGSDLMYFMTGSTERARIDSSGNLLVGTTNFSTTRGFEVRPESAGNTNARASSTSNSSIYSCWDMYYITGGTYAFYVGWNGTINAVNTTISAISDQRLKENIVDLDVGLDAIMALKPRKFDWKAGKGKDIKGDRGWIAQEFETVFPDLIDTWKDPAPEGEEPYKSVRADLIPVLVKAIQEQQAIIESLKARLDAANL